MALLVKLVVLLLCLLGVLAAYTAAGTWRAERSNPPLGEFITVQGLRIHYYEKGQGIPIVLIHGASSNLRDLETIVNNVGQEHRAIAFDRPGYGYSERPSDAWPDPGRQAQLLHDALEQLEVKRPILVGHSWSGSVVLAYLLDYPEDVAGGVLLAGALSPWGGGVAWYNRIAGWPVVGPLFARTLIHPIGQALMQPYIAAVFAPEQPPDDYAERTGAVLALRPNAFRATAEDVTLLSDYLERQSVRYDEITAPVLLVTGEKDTIVPAWNHADRLAERLLHAEHVELSGAGHAIHQSREEEVGRLIADFAKRTVASEERQVRH